MVIHPRINDKSRYFFIGPAIIWILVFTIFPLLYALYTSFFSFRFGKREPIRWSGQLSGACLLTPIYIPRSA